MVTSTDSTRKRIGTVVISKMIVSVTLILALHLDVCSSQDPCQVCTLGPDAVPLPDKLLPPGIPLPLIDCFDFDTLAFLLEEDSDLCRTAQAFGTYCGCNKAADACNLCWDGSSAPKKEHQQTIYEASDFLGEIGAGVNLNCETLEAFMYSTSNTSDQCLQVQVAAGEECGCPPMPAYRNISDVTNATLQPEPIVDGGDVEAVEDVESPRMCTLCETGDPVPFPDKLVVIQRDLAITCSEWEAIASTIREGSDDCQITRSISLLCGCPRPEGSCNFCPLGEPVSKPNKDLNWLEATFLSTSSSSWFARMKTDFFTCEMMDSVMAAQPSILADVFATAEGMVCTAAQMKSWICGCQPDWRPIFLTWAYRLSGMMSFLVSLYTPLAACSPRKFWRVNTIACVACLRFVWTGVCGYHCCHYAEERQAIHRIQPIGTWHFGFRHCQFVGLHPCGSTGSL